MSKNMQTGAATPNDAQTRPDSTHLWTARDVARFARCSLRQVGYFRQDGLPFIKVGQLVRFQPQLVIGWLLSHRPEAQGKEDLP